MPRSKQEHELGELEAEIMRVCWEMRRATVQEVKDALEPARPLAYTTVLTVMTRLAEKGLLKRYKEGRAYVFSPASSQEEVGGSMLDSVVRRLYAGETARAIAHLLETEEAVDDEELERLEALIRARRSKSAK